MDESWRELREVPERIRWARLRTEFARPTDLARTMNIKPGTYRTYEQIKADGGRVPPLTEIQRLAGKLKVSWEWLATGQGTPWDAPINPLGILSQKLESVPAEKREDAMRAAEAVIDAFVKKSA